MFTSKQILLALALLVLLIAPNALHAQLLINEFQSSNGSTIADEDGDFEDWIEILNTGPEPVNLSGYGLSDDPERPYRWIFPPKTLDSGAFLLVWASGKNRRVPQAPLHTNFSISASGEALSITSPSGAVVDVIPPVEVPRDISNGRFPDGSTNFVFFDEPTPGSSNNDSGGGGEIPEAPQLSHAPGFYGSPFLLGAQHADPQAVLRYTIDGREPGPSDPVFPAEGLLIYDRTSENPLISLIPTAGSWLPPIGDVSKPMVVSVRAFTGDFSSGDVARGVYFIETEQHFDHQLPVLSLTTEPENFFDDDIGIYVFGNSEPFGNFWQRGREWERPVYMQWFTADRQLLYEGDAGVRIHGGTSRRFPQKSLRLYFRNSYGDEALPVASFTEITDTGFRRLLLRNSGQDDIQTFFRDAMMHRLLLGMDMEKQAYEPMVVYLNGEYWGLHNLRERQDRFYLARKAGVDPEKVDILEYSHAEVVEGSRQHYENLLAFVENEGLQSDENLSFLSGMMNIENYTDVKIAEIFFYRWDIGNIRFWRPQTNDGIWRWMMFDLDTGYGGFWSVENPWAFDMMAYNTEANGPWQGMQGHNQNSPQATFLLRALLENESYRSYFVSRFYDLLNTHFETGFAQDIIDNFAARIAPEMPRQTQRWRRIQNMESWQQEVDYMKTFAEKRPGFQKAHLRSFFDLPDELTIELRNIDSERGGIKLNTVEIAESSPFIPEDSPVFPWSGKYPAGTVISLKPAPGEGYEFEYWLINGQQNYQEELQFVLEESTEVEIVYSGDGVSVPADREVATLIKLHQNYPNPFNGQTRIPFTLSEPVSVTLEIYSLQGQLVSRLANNQSFPAGTHTINFDTNTASLASGLYLYRLRTPTMEQTRSMMLVK
ncbi:MAG: CotH kinase family protein [Balneolales bacterium]|nr:CotH kinase family protein [Balneolales bacterium]